MKRSEALKPLSHDHHQSLFLSQRLRRIETDSADEVIRAYLDFWHRDGARHFREEEEILFPVYAEHGGLEDPLVAKALLEHVQTRALVGAIERDLENESEAALDLDRLQRLGGLIHDHVRMEERELFPAIEQALPGGATDELMERLAGS